MEWARRNVLFAAAAAQPSARPKIVLITADNLGYTQDLYHGISPVHRKGYSTLLFADATCDFLRRHHEETCFSIASLQRATLPEPAQPRPARKG
jgi:hypothetical protein